MLKNKSDEMNLLSKPKNSPSRYDLHLPQITSNKKIESDERDKVIEGLKLPIISSKKKIAESDENRENKSEVVPKSTFEKAI